MNENNAMGLGLEKDAMHFCWSLFSETLLLIYVSCKDLEHLVFKFRYEMALHDESRI